MRRAWLCSLMILGAAETGCSQAADRVPANPSGESEPNGPEDNSSSGNLTGGSANGPGQSSDYRLLGPGSNALADVSASHASLAWSAGGSGSPEQLGGSGGMGASSGTSMGGSVIGR